MATMAAMSGKQYVDFDGTHLSQVSPRLVVADPKDAANALSSAGGAAM